MLEIVADVHERASGIPSTLERLGAHVTIRSLTRGDYVLGPGSLVERKTAKEDRLALLGLTDPKQNGSTSRLIRFLDASGAPIGEIIVGNKKSDAFGASKNGTYVRRPGETQTWLADRAIDGSAQLKDWTKTRVVDVPTMGWPA